MSELDAPAMSFMKVSPDAGRGYPLEVLEEARLLMEKTGAGNPGMLEAMDFIIAYPDDSPAAFAELREAGRTLIGVHKDRFFDDAEPLDGVFYAEGDGRVSHSDAFSAVRMGLWLPRRKVEVGPGMRQNERRSNLATKVMDLALRNTEENMIDSRPDSFGVPVTRDTVLRAFPNYDNAAWLVLGKDEGGTYGQWKDVLAVEGLEVPDALVAFLSTMTRAAHQHGRFMSFAERIRQLQSMVVGRAA